ncbi:MAG: hypothetical protein J6K81_07830 [Rikenellaceae bacterium]|nr:hypothetical protein [Rikenellaceae bacterium]
MKQHLAILFVSLALAAMCVLECLPHHHHGDVVCFGVELAEQQECHSQLCCGDALHHAEGACDSHSEGNPHGEDDCSLADAFHKLLAASEIRGDIPCIEVALPAWQESVCECLDEKCCTHHGYCHLTPTPYESPYLGVRALRAPPVA